MSESDLRERDQAARRLAQTSFDRPLVLEAGAGTGKTATLVARVLAWCLGPGWQRNSGADLAPSDSDVAARVLERIVAITFTEAAASEMAQRVAEGFAALAAGALPTGTLDDALPEPDLRATRARALLGHIDRLAVRTIHAYCRRLLAAFPLEAGLHPNFAVDADRTRLAQVVREVVESRLREAYADPGDASFLQLAEHGHGPGELEEVLVQALGAGLPSEALERDPFPPDRIAALLEQGRTCLDALRACEGGRLSKVDGRARRTIETDQALHALRPRLDTVEPSRAALDGFAEWLREGWSVDVHGRLRDWARGHFIGSEQKALGEALEELPLHARALREWIEKVRVLQPELLEAARRAVAPLLAEIEGELRAQGIATFETLLRDARRLIVGQPRVRARVQRDIDQLVVDEFQDTDATQCDLVRALALDGAPEERPGLFIVGDPKQSIYGWRQADLAAYQRFVDGVREAGGRVRHLHLNFRSRPGILHEVNRLMASVLREERGLQPGHQELIAYRGPGETPVVVEHWVCWERDPETGRYRRPRMRDSVTLEAEAIATDLRRLAGQGVAWRDMALLMRSRGDLEIYLGALREAGVPFDVEGDRSYYRRREIIDAGALVRCVVDPNDHLSLVTWLRSPSVGLPDAALIPLWARDFPARMTQLCGPDREALGGIRELVADAASAVPAGIPGLERIAGWPDSLLDAVETLAALRASFENDPPDVFVEQLRTRTLIEATEAARYLGRYRVANLERFLRRLTDDLCITVGDASGILRALRRRIREAEEEEEARPKDASDDAVQIRTIHQAKGLDFDHVYLLQAHKGIPSRDEGRICGEVDGRVEYRLFGAPSLDFDRVLARFRQVSQAELVRTLYVGLTRARERLVIAANWPDRGTPRDPHEADSHLELLRWRKGGGPDLGTLWDARAAHAPVEAGEPDGVHWLFPALAPVPEDGGGTEHPLAHKLRSRAEIEADARTLGGRRAAAAREMRRAFGGRAAAEQLEAHRDRREGGAGLARSVATAVGSALHGILEDFDPTADPARERERQRAELPRRLESLVEPDDLERALGRGEDLLERLHAGPLLERLRQLGSDVARELPILAPPAGDGEGPVGYVAGVIDLLYRDPESGEWVVADYKTDAVESEDEIAALGTRYAAQGAVYTSTVRAALGLEQLPRFELWLVHAGRVTTVPPVHSPRP